MKNPQATGMSPSEYEALKEQLRSELMMADESRASVQPGAADLKEELLEEMKRREAMRRSSRGIIGSSLQEGRENWQDFKEDLLTELEERMQGLPLIGNRYGKRPPVTERQLLNELRNELEMDLKAQEIYQRNWRKHPRGYGRLLLQDLMQEAEEQGYTRAQLLQAIQGVQGRGTIKGRWQDWLATPEGRGFKYGAMAAALAMILWPTAQKSMQPLLKWLVQEGMEVTENVQGFFSGMTEDLQDIFAEAQFERGKDLLHKEIAQSMTRDPGNDI